MPALAGRPRQAATDATRRDDLTRPLGTFPAADPANRALMDPDRLCTEPGL
jgi:hypothetical protein